MANSILCGRCSALNPLGSKECAACRKPLFFNCSRCRASVPTYREYCPECGQHHVSPQAGLIRRLVAGVKSWFPGSVRN